MYLDKKSSCNTQTSRAKFILKNSEQNLSRNFYFNIFIQTKTSFKNYKYFVLMLYVG